MATKAKETQQDNVDIWSTIDLREGMIALRAMGEDPDRTEMVSRFLGAMTGPSFRTLFNKVMADPIGRKKLEDQADLLKVLTDREWLGKLDEGTLGKAYYDWTEKRGLSAEGIEYATEIELDRSDTSRAGILAQRVADMHDLWHVINGWDGDMYGEMHMIGYSYSQLGSLAWLWLGVAFNLVMISKLRFEGIYYLINGMLRGNKADLLAAVDWEKMLELPIDEVRQRLNMDPPEPYQKLSTEEFENVKKNNWFIELSQLTLPKNP